MEFIVKPQNFQLPEPLALDCGRMLKGVNIRYETVGTLAPDRSNAILITHALSGDAHVCGRHAPEDPKPGWWDEMVGPGRAIDTNRYFVICSNVLGSCAGSTGPRSVNPDTGNPYNLDFPVITIRDMVRAQRYLIDYLGIEKLLSVVGGSMGGMQAMEWAINYPDRLDSAVPIATTSQLSPQSIAFDWVGREAIKNDPRWNEGNYSPDRVPEGGLATAQMIEEIFTPAFRNTWLDDGHDGATLPVLKNASFEEEAEWRIIFNDSFSKRKRHVGKNILFSGIRYTVREKRLVSYIEMDFSKLKYNAIKEIWIGPKAEVEIQDILHLLDVYGYYDDVENYNESAPIKIAHSASSYR